jgi:predicted anti-sigma-YlaC factor YlaD
MLSMSEGQPMKCRELLGALGDYLDGETQSALCQALHQHLACCDPCRVAIDNVRQTIRLYRMGEEIPLPLGLHEQLRAILQRHWAARSSVDRGMGQCAVRIGQHRLSEGMSR